MTIDLSDPDYETLILAAVAELLPIAGENDYLVLTSPAGDAVGTLELVDGDCELPDLGSCDIRVTLSAFYCDEPRTAANAASHLATMFEEAL